jgi:dihydrolipoamide dehydrogenase
MESIKTDLVVLGAGPGGYAAAFYAADLGKNVILVEQNPRLGGVCLNEGCIPSKALLHAAKLITEAREATHLGITFGEPKVELDKLRAWKESVLQKLGQGVAALAKMRKVTVMTGRGYFENSNTLRVETSEGQKFIQYEKAILAVGSKPALPRTFDLGNPRVMTSREALELQDVPADLLVIGGGYIGMEMGTVYAALGSRVVVVEAMDKILAGADPDLARPVLNYAKQHFRELRVSTRVQKMSTSGKQIKVVMDSNGEHLEELYDRVLVSVGRAPNGEDIGLENTRVMRDEKGFVKVNDQMETTDPALYAIGDIAGGILLAHKAHKEARIAVEAFCGTSTAFKEAIIPAVVFTEPELAWCGLTEEDARAKGIKVEIAKFPWAASGRALTFDRTDGMTKVLFDPESERILGAGIVGHGAGELIAEAVLAIEMGATAQDIAACIHPHPTLSETFMEAAEVFYGYATHAYSRTKRGHE